MKRNPKQTAGRWSFLYDGARVGGDTRPEIRLAARCNMSQRSCEWNICTTYAFLRYWAGDGRALHFTLGVDDNTSVILKVEGNTILSSPGLALADNDGGHG